MCHLFYFQFILSGSQSHEEYSIAPIWREKLITYVDDRGAH